MMSTRMELLEFTSDTDLYANSMENAVACFLEHKHACLESY
jgi:hypothetical protein